MRRSPFLPLLLIAFLLPLVPGAVTAQGPLDEDGSRVDLTLTGTPDEVLMETRFPVTFTLRNTVDEPKRVTLFTGLHAAGDEDFRCGEGSSSFRGYIQLRSPTITVPAKGTLHYPGPHDLPYDHRVAREQIDGPGDYVACVWAVDADSPPPGTRLDSEPFPLKVRVENGLPEVDFTWTPTRGTTRTDFTFTAQAGNDPEGDSLTYHWDFGRFTPNGRAVAEGPTAKHAFYPAGTYVVTLTVRDGFGEAVATREVRVDAAPTNENLETAASPPPATPAPGVAGILVVGALAAWVLRRR